MNRKKRPHPIKILAVVLVFKLVISLDNLQPTQTQAILEVEQTQEQVTGLTAENSEAPTKGESRRDSTSS